MIFLIPPPAIDLFEPSYKPLVSAAACYYTGSVRRRRRRFFFIFTKHLEFTINELFKILEKCKLLLATAQDIIKTPGFNKSLQIV